VGVANPAAGGARGARAGDAQAAGRGGRGLGLAPPPAAGAPPPGARARKLPRGGGAPWRRRSRSAATEGSGGRGAPGGGPGGASREFPGVRLAPGTTAPGRAVALWDGRGLRLGLCRECPPRLGGPRGTPGGWGAGPPSRRRAGAGAALHPPPLSVAAGRGSLRPPPERPKPAGISDLTLCPQPATPTPINRSDRSHRRVSVFGGVPEVSGRGGGNILGVPRPRTCPDARVPLPHAGQRHSKLFGTGREVPSAGATRGIGEGVPGVRRGRPGVRREGGREGAGGSGRPAAPSGFLGPLPARCRFRFRRRLRRGPSGPGGGSRGWLRERSGVPVRRPPLGSAMDSPSPSSALVPLLLLLAAPAPGSCCSFAFNPVSSTFRAHLNNLTPWLLLDYPVAMPSNLEPDSGCSDLWRVHFGAVALQRMLGVAGKDLAPLLRTLLAQLHFVAECHIQDPQGCVRLEMVNVSQLLETLVQHLGELQGRPPHFPGCAHLRCQPGPALTSLAVRHEGTLGARQGPPSPAGHGLVLLGGVGGALGLAAAAWMLWRRPCAQVGPLEVTLGDGCLGGTRGALRVGDTGDAVGVGSPGVTGSTGGCLGVTGRAEDTGSTGEHWEVLSLSPPQPSQAPPTSEQDGT
uniref:Uncharacterized protein n=1 Tax=Corvus moneduloides TaxID=1196302 RepID=A0A8U7NEM1_CORMO